MNYIDFSDINLKINNEIIYCDNVRLSTSIDIAAAFEEESKVPNSFVPTSNYRGQLGLSYYLTGKDFIYDFTHKSETPISVNLGGLTINSGYLSSYSFASRAYSFIKVDAEFTFFEKIKGRVNRSTEIIKPKKLSKIKDITIDKTEKVLEEKLVTFSYSYSTTINPSVEVKDSVKDISVERVSSANKTVKASFATYDYQPAIDLSLPSSEAQFNFQGGQDYKVNGKIVADNTSLNVGENLVREYEVSQGVLDFRPTISGFYPTQGAVGSSFIVSGENLKNVVSVHIFDYLANVTETSSNDGLDYVTVEVPTEPFVGFKRPIKLSTFGGHAVSTGVFEVI